MRMFELFFNEVENQFNRKIKCLPSDRGTEYDSSFFIRLMESSMKELHHSLLK